MVEIRSISDEDIAGFRDVVDCVAREKRFLARTEGPTLEQAAGFVRANIAKGNPHLVAVDGDQVVGWCDIIRNDHLPIYAHSGTLGMGLLPTYRGQRIGRRLLQAALDAARAAGMTRIALTVRADNSAAARLYEQIGFTAEGFHRSTDLIDGVYYDTRSMSLLV